MTWARQVSGGSGWFLCVSPCTPGICKPFRLTPTPFAWISVFYAAGIPHEACEAAWSYTGLMHEEKIYSRCGKQCFFQR